MSNSNYVSDIESIFLAPGLIQDLKHLIEVCSMNTEQFKDFFKGCRFTQLPFQYFSNENMAEIIVDCLETGEFDPENVKLKRNIPKENQKTYSYFKYD